MKLVKWEDDRGNVRASLLRNSDSEDMAESGIPVCPPDLDLIDWNDTKRILYNELVNRGLFTWLDVQKAQSELDTVIKTVFRQKIISLYKDKERADQHTK